MSTFRAFPPAHVANGNTHITLTTLTKKKKVRIWMLAGYWTSLFPLKWYFTQHP